MRYNSYYMSGEQKHQKSLFQSMLHKELASQLYSPYAGSGKKQAPSPAASPSIHLYMDKQQLVKFKTESCFNQSHYDNPNFHNIHHSMQAPYYYSCYYFHSERDRRRLPISIDDKGTEKELYEGIYIGDGFSPNYSNNWIEYLYHPKVYKTKHCDNMVCHRRYCSKLHINQVPNQTTTLQEVVTSFKNSLFENIREFEQLKKQPTLSHLQSDPVLSKHMNEAQQKIMKFVQQLDGLDKKEENKLSHIKNQIIILANASKVREKSKPKQPDLAKKETKSEDNYERLFFNEKLKIIEDRQHEFKMFKDKDPRRIAAMVLQYISAFLNSDGGSIYLGINDESVVLGLQVDNRWIDQFQLAIDSDGRNHLNPPLIPQKYKLRIIPVVHQKRAELKVIQIQVFPQPEAQKKILTLYKKQCYLRMNASNHRLSAADIMEYMRLINIKSNSSSPQGLHEIQSQSKLEQMSHKQLKQYQEYLNKTTSKVLGLMRKKQKQGVMGSNGENQANEAVEPSG